MNDQSVDSKGGYYVIPHVDVVSLDGVIVEGWEDMNAVEPTDHQRINNFVNSKNVDHPTVKSKEVKLIKPHFQYIKYYKPVGVTCTTDPKVKDNIIDSLQGKGYRSPHRIYPVGRLDKDTSGNWILQ